jgi:RND family efflux transporter MFP subunit
MHLNNLGLTLSIIITILGLSSCFVVPKEPEKIDFPEIHSGEVSFHVVDVERQDLVNSITLFGSFEPALKERLFFKYAGGRVLDVYAEEDELVLEGKVLATLNVSGLENQIKLQEIALEKARIRLELLDISGSNKYEHRLAVLEVQSAEIRLGDSREKLDNNRIVAPFDGIVTHIGVEEGDLVQPFEPIISLENTDKLILECDPSFAQHLLQGVEVEVELRNTMYSGVVTQGYRDIMDQGIAALEEESVLIDVPTIPGDTERGESGRITFIEGESKDTIVVQKNHVKTFGDRTFVYLLRDGVKVEQDIVLGLETRSKAEVLEGLVEGDQLIAR